MAWSVLELATTLASLTWPVPPRMISADASLATVWARSEAARVRVTAEEIATLRELATRQSIRLSELVRRALAEKAAESGAEGGGLAAERPVSAVKTAHAANAQSHGFRMKIPRPPVMTGYAEKSKDLKRFWGFTAGTRSLYPGFRISSRSGLAVPVCRPYIAPDPQRAFSRAFWGFPNTGDGPEGASLKARNPSAKR